MLALRNILRTLQRGAVFKCRRNIFLGSSSHQTRVPVASNIEIEDRPVSNTVTDRVPLCDNVHRKPCNVYMRQTSNSIHINLQDMTDDMQCSFCKDYVKELNNNLSKNEITRISFNNLTEDVFRYHVNMQIRKLGYTSVFTRYNGDRGLAEFNFVKREDSY